MPALGGLRSVLWLVLASGALVAAGGLSAQARGCTFKWEVVAELVPHYDVGSGVFETVEQTVTRSQGLDGQSVFSSRARVRLTWLLSREVGHPARAALDLRATAQAAGMGLEPRVMVRSELWEPASGLATQAVESVWGPLLGPLSSWDAPAGWHVELDLAPLAARLRPLVLHTASSWKSVGGRMDLCDSLAVLRAPLLELAQLSTQRPYVVLGTAVSALPGIGGLSREPGSEDALAAEQRAQLALKADSAAAAASSSSGREPWAPLATAGLWSRLSVSRVLGVSWVWFALAHAAGGAYPTAWVSTNAFVGLGAASSSTWLDLAFVYPFARARAEVSYRWHPDSDVSSEAAYDEGAGEDPYLAGAAGQFAQSQEQATPWFVGPCARGGRDWQPQALAYGPVLVASTTWGIAWRSIANASLDSALINYGWRSLAPVCGVVVPRTQLDPISAAFSCGFHVIVTSPGATVPGESGKLDAEVLAGLQLPTVLVGRARVGQCEQLLHGAGAAAAANASSAGSAWLATQTQSRLPTGEPSAAPTALPTRAGPTPSPTAPTTGTPAPTRAADAAADAAVASPFELVELVDGEGRTLAQALGAEANASTVLGVASALPMGFNWTALLVRTQREPGNNASFRLLSALEDNGGGLWKALFTFPAAGAPARPFARDARGLNVGGPAFNADPAPRAPWALTGLRAASSVSSVLYAWGAALVTSRTAGRAWTLVAQAALEPEFRFSDATARALSFFNDPIVQVECSRDGWVAVLTRGCAVWAGREGSDRVFPVAFALCEPPLAAPLALAFDEADTLRVLGLAEVGPQDGLRGLAAARRLDLAPLRAVLERPAAPATKEQPTSGCLLRAVAVAAPQPTALVRELHSLNDFTPRVLAARQDTSFVNYLPERVFLDMGSTYTFVLRLYPSEVLELAVPAPTYEQIALSFELSDQRLVDLGVERSVNLLSNSIDYTVRLKDRRAWGQVRRPQDQIIIISSNSNSSDSNSSNTSYAYGLPGDGLDITAFAVTGRTSSCSNELDPLSVATTEGTLAPLRLAVYSGCPPLRAIVFDPSISRNDEDQGCLERPGEEHICMFYGNSFVPRFRLIDIVTGEDTVVGGSFGQIIVMGGGPTFDTIQEWPEDSRAETSATVLSVASDSPDTFDWLCLVSAAPCYAVPPSFPRPPEYFFVLEFRSNSQSSYCDYQTRFIVRLHNLPLAIEIVVLINIATISSIMAPIVFVFWRRQQRLSRRSGIEDVDLANYSVDQDDASSDSSDSSSSSDDSDSD
jgi:hypothetical protein